MDMVNKQIPTFADKAEALHYFPMWRTWFGLVGLCKLPWNDVTPMSNAQSKEPAKVPEHVQNYADIMSATLGTDITAQDLVDQSERVYNFQRSMNVWMGRGTRRDDWIPFRAKGPVTEMEYLSRQERYDKQLVEKGLATKEALAKMNAGQKRELLAAYRDDQYEKLTDSVYHRRGWTPNGIPTPQKMTALGFGSHKDLLEMLQKKIDEDEKAGLNKWGGKYGKDESPPTTESRYWEKW
jgi:aldehyde:ferredoxin oxidoreductase